MNDEEVIGVGVETSPVSLWTNHQAALDELHAIATESGVEYDWSGSVALPTGGTHLDSDEYYIVEMELH